MKAIAHQMFSQKVADDRTKIRAGVGVILQNAQGEILLEKRSDCGWWGLPGGRIEPGESVLETALREVKEETGLAIAITSLLGIYSEPTDRIVTYPDNIVQLVDVILVGTIVSGTLSCSHESEALQFFQPTALPAEIVPPALAPLQDFINGLTGMIR